MDLEYKKHFKDFLEKYREIVVKDKRTNINIPFVKTVNKLIAKTIMRKPDFKTSSPSNVFEWKTLHEINQAINKPSLNEVTLKDFNKEVSEYPEK